MVNMTLEKLKEPATGALGAGSGLFVGELTSEFAARLTGQTGYAKAGLKTVVKTLIGAVAYGVGGAAVGPWGLFAKAFAFTSVGSSLLDWLYAAFPGGVFGMAERAAVAARTWAVGTEQVATQMGAVKSITTERFNGQSAIEITPPKPTPGQIGKYA